ncbi:hypothetical protein [Actinomadura napierensis]|uniref:hypothetical protein n=1 Tax=Actinomadura napierensis TaxID=267854 RepID=UPI0031D6842C
MEQRNWACELTGAGTADTALRATPPAANSARVAVVVVRDCGADPYFAFASTPHRQFALVDDLDRAVRVIKHVYGSARPPAPYVPEGFVEAAAALAVGDP